MLIDNYKNDTDWFKNGIGHIDWIYITNFNFHIYYKPLCYQSPKTENMSTWDNNVNVILKILINFYTEYIIKF